MQLKPGLEAFYAIQSGNVLQLPGTTRGMTHVKAKTADICSHFAAYVTYSCYTYDVAHSHTNL